MFIKTVNKNSLLNKQKTKSVLLDPRALMLNLALPAFVGAGAQGPVDPCKSLFPNVIDPAPTSKALQKFLGYPVPHAAGGKLMTSYTYRPIIGITSSTDHSGRTTYYSYDGFGRLQAVKDTQSKTTDIYEYHYKQ